MKWECIWTRVREDEEGSYQNVCVLLLVGLHPCSLGYLSVMKGRMLLLPVSFAFRRYKSMSSVIRMVGITQPLGPNPVCDGTKAQCNQKNICLSVFCLIHPC